ncbi:MAG TPA: shikimate dehydrogenase [Polyangiaceae bacterium]|jgi:shikimate dehydrogenase|nr:shikimate dehydrogenase [Polyangiaceae bacterium]
MTEPLCFVLLGHPVGHSVSPAIHGAAYRALGVAHRYTVCDCPTPGDVREQVARLRAGEIAGANVTVPWKRLALELADRADASARATGVANVLSCAADGQIVASNTDAGALAEEITALHAAPRRAAVIGAGGAAQAAVVACSSLGISQVGVSSRGWRLDIPRESWKHASVFASLGATAWAWPDAAHDERPEAFRACLRECDVIIQATSAGMRGAGPGEAVSDWVPWRELPAGAVAIDVVYNPSVTPFLLAAEAAGVASRGGLGMLVRQAALALRIWLGGSPSWVEPDLAELWAAAEAALAQQRRS